jgi:hypothetical protein
MRSRVKSSAPAYSGRRSMGSSYQTPITAATVGWQSLAHWAVPVTALTCLSPWNRPHWLVTRNQPHRDSAASTVRVQNLDLLRHSDFRSLASTGLERGQENPLGPALNHLAAAPPSSDRPDHLIVQEGNFGTRRRQTELWQEVISKPAVLRGKRPRKLSLCSAHIPL